MYSMLPVTAIYDSARHNILKFTRASSVGLVGAAGSCVDKGPELNRAARSVTEGTEVLLFHTRVTQTRAAGQVDSLR